MNYKFMFRCVALILFVSATPLFVVISSAQNVNKEADHQLLEAVRRGDVAAVQAAFKSGANVNAKDVPGQYTPLHWAAYHGNREMVKMLVEQGADVTAKATDGDIPLHVAAWSGHAGAAYLLLEAGSNVNALNNEGMTPLELAKTINFWDSKERMDGKKATAKLLCEWMPAS